MGEISGMSYLLNKSETMEKDFNDKSFSPFITTITNFLLSKCEVKSYFKESRDKNIESQYTIFKLLKKNVKLSTKISDNEMKNLIDKLREKTDEMEYYEFSQLLSDLKSNFSKINEHENSLSKTKNTEKK